MRSIEILCMVVLGGMGNTYGAVLGALMITVLPEFLRSVSPVVAQYRMVLYGLLMVMMIVKPQGILSEHPFQINLNTKEFLRKEDRNDETTRR